MERILCPYHEEATPSMVIYDDGGYCFGCGKWATNEELGRQDAEGKKVIEEKEDIQQTISYISQLGKRELRGLVFPCDGTGIFLVWPEGQYYKRRRLEGTIANKYTCPKGHKQPLLNFNKGKSIKLIVEGEINALSIKEATQDLYHIICPGGSTSFDRRIVGQVREDNLCLIVVDSDAAGVSAYIKLASLLYEAYPNIIIKKLLMDEDANDILVKHGKEVLKETITKALNG